LLRLLDATLGPSNYVMSVCGWDSGLMTEQGHRLGQGRRRRVADLAMGWVGRIGSGLEKMQGRAMREWTDPDEPRRTRLREKVAWATAQKAGQVVEQTWSYEAGYYGLWERARRSRLERWWMKIDREVIERKKGPEMMATKRSHLIK